MIQTIEQVPAYDVSDIADGSAVPPLLPTCVAFRVLVPNNGPPGSRVRAVLTGPHGDVRRQLLISDAGWVRLGVDGTGPWWLEATGWIVTPLVDVLLADDGTEDIIPLPVREPADPSPLPVVGAGPNLAALHAATSRPVRSSGGSEYVNGGQGAAYFAPDNGAPYAENMILFLRNDDVAARDMYVDEVYSGAEPGTWMPSPPAFRHVLAAVPAGAIRRVAVGPGMAAVAGIDLWIPGRPGSVLISQAAGPGAYFWSAW